MLFSRAPMNALVLQCGGPTAVVNITLAALVRQWSRLVPDAMLFGGSNGLGGLLSGDWRPLSCDESWLSRIEGESGMALGGGRVRLREPELETAVMRLASQRIETLFLIGGNGTMAAGRALARAGGGAVRVIGIPKTIDNDIPGTDVCPGFPSAARFLIECVRDIAADAGSMRGYEDVVLIEAMGRHSGWLAAATELARSSPHDAPHLVLIPEAPVDDELFLARVGAAHARSGLCVVTVAEGVRDGAGTFLAERCADRDAERDASGQIILGRSGGPLPYLASLVRERLGLRCRLVRPDVLQRCSRAHVTPLDRTVAAMAGGAAVDHAVQSPSRTPVMIALRQEADAWWTEAVPLDHIRGERTLPAALHADASLLRIILPS